MVSHNMMIHEDTFRDLKELKMKMSQEKDRTVSFTEVINELLEYYGDNAELSYEETDKVSK